LKISSGNSTFGASIILPHEALYCFIWALWSSLIIDITIFYILIMLLQYQPIGGIKCRKM